MKRQLSLMFILAAGCSGAIEDGVVPRPTVTPSPSPTPQPTPSPTVEPSPSPTALPGFDEHWVPREPTEKGPVDVLPEVTWDGKTARRLSVDQLRKSIPALFAGITWTNGRTPTSMFNTLSRTLGEADYLQATQENMDPTPVFSKFMDDMAGSVCTQAVQRDTRQTAPADRVVAPWPTDVPRTLRFLRLKLHGIHVPDGSMDGLQPLADLHAGILADTRNDMNQAWIGVCVAMLTAPEFLAY